VIRRQRQMCIRDSEGLWLTTSNTDGRGKPGREDDRILRLEVR
ncbi:PQQ-dependent sugar dehydrogenase, partial [Streptomyces albiflaviniger]|nr:PQQ-dependent sugar dehydrogenase [Streptomyces albiflaviniger]